MCNGKCSFFQRKTTDRFFYCQDCAKKVGESYLIREKNFGRLRCGCCNGLVRTNSIIYKKILS